MRIEDSIRTIKNILDNDKYPDNYKLMLIEQSFPNMEFYEFISVKDDLLKQAYNSNHTKFRLIAAMNSNPQSIFNWCDDEYNFIGMCIDSEYEQHKVEYTLDELSDVIDGAESWLKSIKKGKEYSGSPYFISNLEIMGV